jgi:hypothetical protein
MDDLKRQQLSAQLLEAQNRQAQVREQLRVLRATIEQVRIELGNPYFYGGRPAGDSESQAHFTGYKSHEPGLALLREWQDATRQVARVRKQLHDAGSE